MLSERLSIPKSLTWNLVHAEAVDRLCGTELPEQALGIRLTAADLMRILSHIAG